MKNLFYLFLFIILICGCEQKKEEFPNVRIEQIMEDINWNDNYNQIKKVLENEYNLDYEREVEQEHQGKKVYKFTGGRINGINTRSWSVTFNNDSLDFIFIAIELQSKEKKTKVFNQLKGVINSLPFDGYSKEDNFWIVSENGKDKYGLQLISNKDIIVLTLSSDRYLEKYSSL